KTRVPLGVVFFIYESRPNVTADAAAICLKSGNAVILRGGKEAAHSSAAIVEILQEAAIDNGLPAEALHLVDTPDRAAVGHFLPRISSALAERGIEMRADERSRPRLLVPGVTLATEEDYATEFLGPIISVKIVDSLAEAIEHINRYGSKHTDAIVTGELAAAR